jgi:UDPglucose 6-dehydrogenase
MAAGATVRAYDPQGMKGAKAVLPGLEYGVDAYDAMAAADGVVIATEWKEFATLDLDTVRTQVAAPVIVDLRNLLDPAVVVAAGFRYTSVGR